MERLNKKRLHQILDFSFKEDALSRTVSKFIILLILISIAMVILETINSIAVKYGYIFKAIELFIIIVFTLEYCLRLWLCNIEKRFSKPVVGRIMFMLTPLALIDLFAFLPFYLPFVLPLSAGVSRTLRILRLFRIFMLGRYSDSLLTLGEVLKSKKRELLTTLVNILILLILASSFMYLVEHPVQPDVFASIPDAMWWGVATLTTVGYGDMYPITPLGKILGAVIAILGIGVFALPVGIIAAGFNEKMHEKIHKEHINHLNKHVEHLDKHKEHLNKHVTAHKKHLDHHISHFKNNSCSHCGKKIQKF